MQKNTTNILSLPKLAIKLNTRITDSCPLCGEATNPNIGVEVVDDETGLVVCRRCTLQHAPELAYLMSLSDTARLLAVSERDFGVKFESIHFPERIGGNSPDETNIVNLEDYRRERGGVSWDGFDENQNMEVAR